MPPSPSSLGLAQVLALAGILGLALGLVAALVVESMDKRIADVASFEREYRLRALAVVPQKAFRRQGLRAGSGDLEPFRILRTAVDFARVTRPVRTVMVTSAVRGEGKTERRDRARAGDRPQRPPGDPRRARPASSDLARAFRVWPTAKA